MSVGKRYEPLELPLDSDGFVRAFRVDQEAEFMAFFNEYGFVVIEGVLSQEACDNTVQDIWLELENVRIKENPDRNDPRTWERWPGLASLGLFRQALTHFAWENRLNGALRRAFRRILGTEKVWVSVDNFGVLRPTRQIPLGPLPYTPTRTSVEDKAFDVGDGEEESDDDGEGGASASGAEGRGADAAEDEYRVEDRSEWRSKDGWLHWDLNPFAWCAGEGVRYRFDNFITENNGSMPVGSTPKLQGLVNLIDARAQDGGFLTVPGFHRHLREWAAQEHLRDYALGCDGRYDFVNAPKDDPMQNQVKRITMRAGSLVIWNSEQPHCNYPNDSDRFRMVQYIKCFPEPTEDTASALELGKRERRRLMQMAMAKGLDPSDIAALSDDDRCFLGLQDYP